MMNDISYNLSILQPFSTFLNFLVSYLLQNVLQTFRIYHPDVLLRPYSKYIE